MAKTIIYDTNALLELQGKAFDNDSFFWITDITLNELENIKSSGKKDEETKFNARRVLHLLDEHENQYKVILSKEEYLNRCKKFDLVDNPDTRIIFDAYCFLEDEGKLDEGIFITDDLACKMLAKAVGLNVESVQEQDNEEYTGFVEITLSEEEMSEFYSKILYQHINEYHLLENQYLIIKNTIGYVVDKYKWKDNDYIQVSYPKFASKMFGKVVPKDNDIYQHCAMDSMASNQVTLVRGPAGSGKSFLSLAYLFSELEHGNIDKIIIFCNTVAAKGAAKLGFYPGDKDSKLLDSQIGNMLMAKLGDKIAVERMIEDRELILLPLSDIRGFDTTGMRAGVYITEAQNLDIELLKLALQRIGEDCICIIDGDDKTQVDMSMYAGSNNGIRRMSEVFRGSDIYGEVTLVNIHRSKLAELAQKM